MRTVWLWAFALGCSDGAKDSASVVGGDTQEAGADTGDSTLAACDAGTAEGLMECVDGERYVEDLSFIAQERVPDSAHWQDVQDLCAARFAEAGFEVQLHDYGTGVNVVGSLPGAGSEELVLFTAHYDHIAGCEGADDNASGVAAVLELSRLLALAEHERGVVVACWDEEESGLIGSTAWAAEAAAQGKQIAGVFNLDMIGFASDEPYSQQIPKGIDLLFPEEYKELEANEFRADFIGVLGDEASAEQLQALQTRAEQIDLPIFSLEISSTFLPYLSDLLRSDHAPFWDQGYPAMLMGDTASYRNPYYHCAGGQDSVDTLDTDFAVQVLRATVGAGTDALGG